MYPLCELVNITDKCIARCRNPAARMILWLTDASSAGIEL